MYVDFIRRCRDYKSGFKEYRESDFWLTCSINGSCLVTIYTCFMYENRNYVNVNSFIGHSVVLQYVTVHRVEQILSAKTRLNANVMQWRHKYAN